MPISRRATLIFSFAALVATAVHAQDAQLHVLFGVDASDEAGMQEHSLGAPIAPSMSAALANRVQVKQTTNLGDAMRATGTEENDILIVPPHVTAAALTHGYQLLARNVRSARFVLVARSEVGRVEEMPGKRLYLTQADSARTYLAKGMLREVNIALGDFQKVTYARTSGAGFLALEANLSDVTVAEESEAKRWIETHPGVGKIIKTTRELPAGVAIVVKRSVGTSERRALLAWVNSPAGNNAGLGKLQEGSPQDNVQYGYIAALAGTAPAVAVNAPSAPKVLAVDSRKNSVMLDVSLRPAGTGSREPVRAVRSLESAV